MEGNIKDMKYLNHKIRKSQKITYSSENKPQRKRKYNIDELKENQSVLKKRKRVSIKRGINCAWTVDDVFNPN